MSSISVLISLFITNNQSHSCVTVTCFSPLVFNVNLRAEGGTRRGNMGHLTRIANMVVQNLEKGPVQAQIADLIKGDQKFTGQLRERLLLIPITLKRCAVN